MRVQGLVPELAVETLDVRVLVNPQSIRAFGGVVLEYRHIAKPIWRLAGTVSLDQ